MCFLWECLTTSCTAQTVQHVDSYTCFVVQALCFCTCTLLCMFISLFVSRQREPKWTKYFKKCNKANFLCGLHQTVGEITLIELPLVCHSPSVHVHQYRIWQRGFVCAVCALPEYCEPACYCTWHFSAFQHPLLFHISSTQSQSIAGSQ